MRLNSARQAWHDAHYQPWDSVMAHAMELAKLGNAVQKTERNGATARAAHQAIAGRVQGAIHSLPGYVAAFGHHLYNPLATNDQRETAEAAVAVYAYDRHGRMTAKKAERAKYVAAGVLHRYRRMNQGGQGAMPDHLVAPEAFRAWLDDEYGVRLASESWDREWGGFIRLCFDVCNDIDRRALGPVAAVIEQMKDAA